MSNKEGKMANDKTSPKQTEWGCPPATSKVYKLTFETVQRRNDSRKQRNHKNVNL